MSAPQHYSKVTELTAGVGITGGYKAVMVKAGVTAAVANFYVYPADYQFGYTDGTGKTASMEVAVPANTANIVPIRIAEYNSVVMSPVGEHNGSVKVYGLN